MQSSSLAPLIMENFTFLFLETSLIIISSLLFLFFYFIATDFCVNVVWQRQSNAFYAITICASTVWRISSSIWSMPSKRKTSRFELLSVSTCTHNNPTHATTLSLLILWKKKRPEFLTNYNWEKQSFPLFFLCL